MDPQKLSQLDPKLREAYQRVMGTPVPQPRGEPASPRLQRGEPVQAQTPPMPTPPMPDPTPMPPPQPEPEPPSPTAGVPTPIIEEPPAASRPPIQPTPEPAIPIPSPTQASNFVQMNSEVGAMPDQTIALKKKNGIMMPVLFGVMGLVFIVIYTLFWTKIFNFKIPFLP